MHGGIANDVEVQLVYINAEDLETETWPQEMFEVDGLLVPIGFGPRGVEGKIRAIRYAREKRVPMFGICLGMQCMVIEMSRNACGLEGAQSTEFDEVAPDPVIYKLRDLLGVEEMGGTMRLGAYPCVVEADTLAAGVYGATADSQDGRLLISERHRHRYEVNQKYLGALQDAGIVVSGRSPDGKFVEIVELPDHPWFLGCQFHPEYRSRPADPHPLFISYIRAAVEQKQRTAAASTSAGDELPAGGAEAN